MLLFAHFRCRSRKNIGKSRLWKFFYIDFHRRRKRAKEKLFSQFCLTLFSRYDFYLLLSSLKLPISLHYKNENLIEKAPHCIFRHIWVVCVYFWHEIHLKIFKNYKARQCGAEFAVFCRLATHFLAVSQKFFTIFHTIEFFSMKKLTEKT